MCNNCAFSLESRPNVCMECQICIRNPANVSMKFKPTQYKDTAIEKLIDMYISKEFMEIIRLEFKKTFEEALRRGPLQQDSNYWARGMWSQ